MAQAKTKPLTFVEFLERETDDGQTDLLADGSLVAAPEEAEVNGAIALSINSVLRSTDQSSYLQAKINTIAFARLPKVSVDMTALRQWMFS